nr:glucoamylase family protein [Bremerella cremea]
MQQRCYRYFLEAVEPTTQFVADRAAADGTGHSAYASSAACGFGLAAHAVAAKYHWIPREQIQQRVQRMLRSLVEVAAHEKGFLYHFFDTRSGARALQSEASTIDTALLLAGAMTASVAFSDDSEITSLADQLYERIDWNWMLADSGCLHMGYRPEQGVLPYQWDQFSEHLILTLLAIGAPSNPIPASSWKAWRREPMLNYRGYHYLSYPPLFVHQYPGAFFNFQQYVSPQGRNYWENTIAAHHAQLAFQIELAQKYPEQFGHYGPDLWGLTSSDSAQGYRDWGGPYRPGRVEPDRGIDGTVVPSAAAGGLAAVPETALRTLNYQKANFGKQIYGRYGFVNAFNPSTGWVDRDVIGIDTGISLLMAENLLTGDVWNLFMQHPAATRALKLAGFTPVGSSLLTSNP